MSLNINDSGCAIPRLSSGQRNALRHFQISRLLQSPSEPQASKGVEGLYTLIVRQVGTDQGKGIGIPQRLERVHETEPAGKLTPDHPAAASRLNSIPATKQEW
jgi:hypothetical protein